MSERFDPHHEAQNAALVAFELEVVSAKVDRFGWKDLSSEMKQRLSDDWTSVLRSYPISEVKRGIGDCLDDNPRRCPNEHDVKSKIMKRRQSAMQRLPRQEQVSVPHSSPDGTRITPERMREIMDESKFDPTANGMLPHRMPGSKARSDDE